MKSNTIYKENQVTKIDENEECKKCIYCEAYDSCNGAPCPYILDLAKVGARSYEDFLKDYLWDVKNVEFRKKVLLTSSYFNGNWFQSEKHKERFFKAIKDSNFSVETVSNRQLSTLYLLTAENPLWQMVKSNTKRPSFLPKAKDIEGATSEQYALFQIAKSIVSGTNYSHWGDLCNKKLVSFPVFCTIVRGLLLRKYGADLLEIRN